MARWRLSKAQSGKALDAQLLRLEKSQVSKGDFAILIVTGDKLRLMKSSSLVGRVVLFGELYSCST